MWICKTQLLNKSDMVFTLKYTLPGGASQYDHHHGDDYDHHFRGLHMRGD